MNKIKITFLILAGAVCFTGCSLFEKAESEDMDAIMSAITGAESDSSEESLNSDGTPVASGETTEETEVNEEVSTGSDFSSDASDTSASNIEVTPVIEENISKTYIQGEESVVSFKSDSMETAVIGKLTLDSVIRGEDAQYIIDMYNSDHVDQQILANSNQELEFCVANYTIDLEDTEGVPQSSTEIACQIGGADAASQIHYNNKVYDNFPTLYNPTDYTVISGESGNGQIIFMLPVGCTSYSITFGDSDVQASTYVFN